MPASPVDTLAAGDGPLPLSLSLFDERDMAEITSPEDPGERLIVRRTPRLAAERARKRMRMEPIEATERDLARLAAQSETRQRGRRTAVEIAKAVGPVLATRKVGMPLEGDIADGRLAWRRHEAGPAAEARLDGVTVIRSAVPAAALDTGQTVRAYRTWPGSSAPPAPSAAEVRGPWREPALRPSGGRPRITPPAGARSRPGSDDSSGKEHRRAGDGRSGTPCRRRP